ncbi:MAG TPA: M1 family aminopeptidase [Allosphingosinicella sp.]|jgi:hypothetical protein
MELDLDAAAHAMAVQGTLTLPPESTDGAEVKLRISHAAGPIAWSSRTPGVAIRAKPLPVEGNAATSNPSAKGARTLWTLTGNWNPHEAVTVAFSYSVVTPEPDGFLYVGPEIAFGAGGWYPQIGGSKATSVLRIRAGRGTVISSAGLPMGPEAVADGLTTRSFAASVPGELFFAVSPPGSNAVALSPKLRLATLKPRPSDAGWRRGLQGVADALEAEFGPLPYPQVTVVEVPDAIADKAGFGAFAAPGAVLARSMFIDQPFNPAAFAHEFAHLWWGNHIGLEGKKGDFLLDEGLAQYGSMVATDKVLGAAAGARYRRRGIPGFNESLYSALGYLKIEASGLDRPLLALDDDGLSYWIAYSKAGLAWYAVAEDMGRPNFRAALRAVARTHGAGTVTWEAFLAELQRHSRRPLGPLIEAWFGRPGAPAYSLRWRHEGRWIEGQVVASAAAKPAALDVEARFGNGRRARLSVHLAGGAAAFRMRAGGPATALILDPDYKILRWTPELRTEAEAMAQHMRGLVLARLGRKDEAERVLLAILADRPADNRFDRILLTHASLVRLAEDRGCPACAVSHVQAALAVQPQQLAPLAPTYLGLTLAARRLKRGDLAEQAAALALRADALVGNANGVAARLEPPAPAQR